ncbi:hypothetical protein V8E51_011296 [Hyaloscypha variabilis]
MPPSVDLVSQYILSQQSGTTSKILSSKIQKFSAPFVPMPLVTTRPSYCSGSAFGAPEFGGAHPPVEEIKEQARARQVLGQLPRSVDLVYKVAKEKGRTRGVVYKGLSWLTGRHFRSALHWALRIGSTYFELHLEHGTGNVDFIARAWDQDRLKLLRWRENNFGTTYMTDKEILTVGRHYIFCWDLDYDPLNNNCQILLIAVCRDCLEEPHSELSTAWSGYKGAAPMVKALLPFSHGTLALMGCPKNVRHEWDEAMVDFYLTAVTLLYTKRYAQQNYLRKSLKKTSDPIETLIVTWLRRSLYSAHMLHAVPTLFPYPEAPESDAAKFITNLRNQSQKWTNRTWPLFLPGGVMIGSVLYVRDLVVVALIDHRAIIGAFSRRSKAKAKP